MGAGEDPRALHRGTATPRKSHARAYVGNLGGIGVSRRSAYLERSLYRLHNRGPRGRSFRAGRLTGINPISPRVYNPTKFEARQIAATAAVRHDQQGEQPFHQAVAKAWHNPMGLAVWTTGLPEHWGIHPKGSIPSKLDGKEEQT